MVVGYWNQHPPWSRSGGPPDGSYTVSVPAYWNQSYLEAVDTFTLRSEDDGLSPATIFISQLQRTVGGAGMSRGGKTIIVVVRGNMPLQFRYTADPDDFERDETTALEAVKSLEFK